MSEKQMPAGMPAGKGKWDWKSVCLLLSICSLLVAGALIFRLVKANRFWRAQVPYLIQGEAVPDFSLQDMDGKAVDAYALREGKPCLIFIFEQPCSPCNKNMPVWQKLAQILGDKVNVYGVVIADLTTVFNFSQQARLNIRLYAPRDRERFVSANRIFTPMAQTILSAGGRVRYARLGNIEFDEIHRIRRLAEEVR